MGALRVVQRGWALALIASVAVVAAGFGAPSPAHARPSAAVRKCDPDAPPSEVVVEACSAALQDETMQPPARAHLMLTRAMAEQSMGRNTAAIADYTQVIETDTQRNEVVTKSQGDADYYRQTDGRNLYLAVIRADLASAYANRGMVYSAQGDGDRATSDLTEDIRLAPGQPEGYLARSIVYAQLGKPAEALADADRAEQLGATAASVWNTRCWARAIGNFDLASAGAACDRAVKLAPSGKARAEALDSRAVARFRQGQYDLAVADEDAAIAIAPTDPHYRFVRALAEQRLGKAPQAHADMEAARAADPDIADEYARWGLKPKS